MLTSYYNVFCGIIVFLIHKHMLQRGKEKSVSKTDSAQPLLFVSFAHVH